MFWPKVFGFWHGVKRAVQNFLSRNNTGNYEKFQQKELTEKSWTKFILFFIFVGCTSSHSLLKNSLTFLIESTSCQPLRFSFSNDTFSFSWNIYSLIKALITFNCKKYWPSVDKRIWFEWVTFWILNWLAVENVDWPIKSYFVFFRPHICQD